MNLVKPVLSLANKIFLLLLLFLSLAGCAHIPKPSFIQNRNNEYLCAKSIPPIHIPPGMSSSAFSNQYPLVERNYPRDVKNVSLIPPGLYS